MEPWLDPHMIHELLMIMAKVTVVYAFMLIGLRVVGRRTLSDLGPQELILVTLLAKLVGDELIPKDTGLAGNLVGGMTLFALVLVVNKFPAFRHWIEPSPVVVYEHGRVYSKRLEHHMMSERDLERTARDYGRKSYADFERIVLERDGQLTGVLKPQPRQDSVPSTQSDTTL
jgi:uncharacterized membrane protein YcaP (DUF421 family)